MNIQNLFDGYRGDREQLAEDDERTHIAQAQLGDQDAQMILLDAYAPLMRKAVKATLRSADVSAEIVEDRRSVAVMALLEAIQTFDLERYRRLAATAGTTIAQALREDGAGSVFIPERTLKRFFAIMRKADGDTIKAAALSSQYEMRPEVFLAVLDAVRAESYDATDEWGEGLWANVSDPDALAAFASAEDKLLVEFALGKLDGFERDVVRYKYGFSDYADRVKSDAEVAEQFLISRQVAQRTHAGALGTLREALLPGEEA